MNKMKKKVAMILMVCFMVTMCFSVTAFAATWKYTDTTNNHWAYQQVGRMVARGVIGGYEDNTIRPDHDVTQFEAVLMAMRVMGLENEASNVADGEYLPFTIPKWDGAYESAVVAYRHGLIDTADFAYDQPASREWVAKLLVKVLNKESAMESASGTYLPFSDVASIGSAYNNYIKYAYSIDLLGGYPDGTYKPQRNVSRAELAAFLTRAENKMTIKADNLIIGKITGINGVGITVSDRTVYATTNAMLFDKDGNEITTSSLKVDDTVYLVYDNNLVTYLEVYDPAVAPSVSGVYNIEGVINYISNDRHAIVVKDANDKLTTIVVSDTTVIKQAKDNASLTIANLVVNEEVGVTLGSDKQTAVQIVVKNEVAADTKSGVIYLVDANNNLIVMNRNGSLETYTMAKGMEVSVTGKLNATVNDLAIGNVAEFKAEDGVMNAIVVTSVGTTTTKPVDNSKVTITSIDTDKKILIYTTANNDLEVNYYTADTSFEIDGFERDASYLSVGDIATLVFNGEYISKVVVNNSANLLSSTAIGVLYSLDTTNRLIFVDYNGELKNYKIASNATINYNGNKSYLTALKQGMNVRLVVVGQEVTTIIADDYIRATVTAVDTSVRTITVKTADGISKKYNVRSDAYVEKFGISVNGLSAVKKGDNVLMILLGTSVDEILVITDETVTVTQAASGSSKTIYVKGSDGIEKSLYVNEYAITLTVPGVSYPDVYDLKKGESIHVYLIGEELISIESSQKVVGTVSAISVANGTFTLTTFDGTKENYALDADSKVMINDVQYSNLNNVTMNDRVMVTRYIDGTLEVRKLNVRTSDVAVNNMTYIFLVNSAANGDWTGYELAEGCYIHSGNTVIASNAIKAKDTVTLYYYGDMAYEVIK